MEKDPNMYDEHSGKELMVRTPEICENLGKIDYIFCDKTGVLTKNVMQLKKFYIDEMMYGYVDEEIYQNHYCLCTKENSHILYDRKVAFRDPKYKYDISQNNECTIKLDKFMRGLTLCHTIVPEMKNNKIKYRASSQDEIAFVRAGRALGYDIFVNGNIMTLEISTNSKIEKYNYEV